MSDRAKELAGEIISRVSEFEDCSPDLSGHVTTVSNSGDAYTVDWNLHLEDDKVEIVIETGSNAIYMDQEDLLNMLKATQFFETLEPKQRKIIMSILEYDEDE